MNILVTGANGQLGNEMQIVSRQTGDTYFFTDVCEGYEKLDITDLDSVRQYVKCHAIEAIINCAAYTNVDAAETNQELAEELNAKAPQNLAVSMKEVNGLLIHISTDYVFGKEPYNTPCKEDQKGTPTGVYGLTKLHGEQNIIASNCKHIIIRTAWLYSEYGKNFCKTMLNLTATKPQLKVVFDQVGTPTYALDLAKAIAIVLEDYKTHSSQLNAHSYTNSGIYHFSNEGVCSWYDFAEMIQQFAFDLNLITHQGQDAPCAILPCHSNEFPSPVVRPAFSVLDKTKIKETFHIEIPYWTDSLRQCIANISHSQG